MIRTYHSYESAFAAMMEIHAKKGWQGNRFEIRRDSAKDSARFILVPVSDN